MHVIVATDGSKQSLAAAKQLKSFADPAKITDDLGGRGDAAAGLGRVRRRPVGPTRPGRRRGADVVPRRRGECAVATVAAVYDGWGPKVHQRIRSGSPANEIIKAAKQYDAGLVVVAAGGRGLSDSVLVGSTAQRVQHYAPCPVLVVRPAKRSQEGRKR